MTDYKNNTNYKYLKFPRLEGEKTAGLNKMELYERYNIFEGVLYINLIAEILEKFYLKNFEYYPEISRDIKKLRGARKKIKYISGDKTKIFNFEDDFVKYLEAIAKNAGIKLTPFKYEK